MILGNVCENGLCTLPQGMTTVKNVKKKTNKQTNTHTQQQQQQKTTKAKQNKKQSKTGKNA